MRQQKVMLSIIVTSGNNKRNISDLILLLPIIPQLFGKTMTVTVIRCLKYSLPKLNITAIQNLPIMQRNKV